MIDSQPLVGPHGIGLSISKGLVIDSQPVGVGSAVVSSVSKGVGD